MRIGAKLPSSGPLARHVPLRESAQLAEEAGFDSLWVSDHVVMLRQTTSPYPFSSDGRMAWDPEDPWYDALISMAVAVAVTDRVEIGVAVLIVPQRNPVVLAKQLASLDALSNGRVVVGAGAGWLAEEFEALGTSFETRGERLDEWIEIMRECWTGEPHKLEYRHYGLPHGVLCHPTPAHEIPILIGGMSAPALRRVAKRADGWLALQHANSVDLDMLRAGLVTIQAEAQGAGRVAPERAIIRLTGSTDSVSQHLSGLAQVGFTDVIVDVDWLSEGGATRTLETLRAFVL